MISAELLAMVSVLVQFNLYDCSNLMRSIIVHVLLVNEESFSYQEEVLLSSNKILRG